MFFCELCRTKNGWPQSYGGSYGRCEVCGVTNDCYDVPSKLLPIPELGTSPIYNPPPKPKTDVHTAHCCQMHGCKYGRSDCTVKIHGGQEQMCDFCYEDIYEDGGYEDAKLLNEMFDKGKEFFLKRFQQMIEDVTKFQEKLRG